MKLFVMILLTLALMLGACGSDVTGPEIEDPPPDTTWEHTVELTVEVYNYTTPQWISITWLEDGELTGLSDTLLVWQYEMEGCSGDSIYLASNALGQQGPYPTTMYISIFVDGEFAESGGEPSESESCSYIIP